MMSKILHIDVSEAYSGVMPSARWFVPYLAVSAIHVLGLACGQDGAANTTKFLLMPALVVAIAGSLRLKFRAPDGALVLALVFAWVGDIFVSNTGSSSFIIGLAAFLCTHVVYFVLFIRSLRTRHIPWSTTGLVVWWMGMLLLLRDDLGVFLLLLAIYGIVLGASTAAAFATSATIATGAVLFLVSDTSLAWALFAPTGAWWNSDAVIMALYVSGQLLIVTGFLRLRSRAREAASVTG